MASTYTTNQGIEKPAAGDQSGTWGGTVNTNMDIIDRAICGVASLTLTGSTTTLTTTDGTLTDGMYRVLILGDGGDLGSDNTITISPNDQSKCYLVYNNLTANRNAIFTQGSGGNITVSNGATAWIYADGAGAGAEVRQGMVSTEIADQDGDTKIQVEEGGDDDDTIRFDIAGAEDFTMSANSLNILTGSVVALPDATVGAPALTNTGDLDTGVYFPAADQLGVVVGGEEKVRFGSNPFTGRNLLINGDMRISQRGTLTDQGGSNLTGTACDRWVTFWSAGTEQARFTTSQDTTVLAGSGFANSLKVDCTTAESAVAAGEGEFILQSIEGQNCQHLLYGNAAARSLTLSFDFRSPKSGTHCVALVQPDAARSYVAEFTVAGADTMEHFSLTIAGDTSGTINDDTGAGLRVVFPLIAGSNLQAAAGAWAAGTDYATSNQQNLLDNTANNIYITGVQLEVGEVATAFEHRGVAEELALCQRYFWRQTRLAGNTDTHIVTGYCDSTTGVEAALRHPTTMRSSASMTVSAVDDFYIRHRAANTATNGVTDADFGPFAGMLIFTVASGLTAGEGCVVALQTNGDWIEFNSEM